jgi:hypothetical protein
VGDGNPILAAESVPLRKAVRVIQHDAGEGDRLVVWTDERWDEQAGPLEELVLCLYLDPRTEAEARRLLAAWLTGEPIFGRDDRGGPSLPQSMPNWDAADPQRVA